MAHTHGKGFNVLGIPIRIAPSWFLIAALVAWSLSRHYFPFIAAQYAPLQSALDARHYWLLGIGGAVLLYLCIVLHELGHSLMARLFGLPVACVTLFVFGGVSQIASRVTRPWVEFVVAVAGPAVSAAIALFCSWLLPTLPIYSGRELLVVLLVNYLATVNWALLIFNMMPGYPLDGGRVLRSILWGIKRDGAWATRVASGTGIVFGVLMMLFGAWTFYRGAFISGFWYLLLGRFLAAAARSSYDLAELEFREPREPGF